MEDLSVDDVDEGEQFAIICIGHGFHQNILLNAALQPNPIIFLFTPRR